MARLSCDDARELLLDSIQNHKSIPSLAQAILSLCPSEQAYVEFINDAVGVTWPDPIRQAVRTIRRSTGISIRCALNKV